MIASTSSCWTQYIGRRSRSTISTSRRPGSCCPAGWRCAGPVRGVPELKGVWLVALGHDTPAPATRCWRTWPAATLPELRHLVAARFESDRRARPGGERAARASNERIGDDATVRRPTSPACALNRPCASSRPGRGRRRRWLIAAAERCRLTRLDVTDRLRQPAVHARGDRRPAAPAWAPARLPHVRLIQRSPPRPRTPCGSSGPDAGSADPARRRRLRSASRRRRLTPPPAGTPTR